MKMSQADFSRVCAECENHTRKGTFHTCNAPVDLITGQPAPQQCNISRSDKGHCGPQGRSYIPRGVVGGTTAAPSERVVKLAAKDKNRV
jgi:hypothetical protein